jgi:hypothetical protein
MDRTLARSLSTIYFCRADLEAAGLDNIRDNQRVFYHYRRDHRGRRIATSSTLDVSGTTNPKPRMGQKTEQYPRAPSLGLRGEALIGQDEATAEVEVCRCPLMLVRRVAEFCARFEERGSQALIVQIFEVDDVASDLD